MRRESGNRHRASFLVQLGPQLAEMAALVAASSDEETVEAVGNDLRRCADTADRLGLTAVGARARGAAADAASVGWPTALRAVALAAAASDDATPFGPVFVFVPSDRIEAMQLAAENTCERVVVCRDTELSAPGIEVPAAVVLPAVETAAIRLWATSGVPVIAWGDDDAWPVRVSAVSAGASCYLAGALDLEIALDQARKVAWQRSEAPVAAVLGDANGLAAALSACGVRVIPPTEPVDTWSPDAAVVAGREPSRLLGALRAHPGWARTAVLALVDGPVAGADEVLAPDTPRDVVITRLRAWLDRVRSVPVDRDPLTGLPNRLSALRALDRWLAWGRRSNTPLSVGLLFLDGLADLRGTSSLAAEAAVHRATADALTRTLRRLDVIGRIGPSLYVAGLPNCRSDEARKRLGQCSDLLGATLANDPRAAGVTPALGLADSAHTAERLLARAWENLALVRQGV